MPSPPSESCQQFTPPNGHCRPKLRRALARTRTGCLACRLRKKKCDELKPKCQACIRNKLDCSWPFPIIQRLLHLGKDTRNSIRGSQNQEAISRPDPDRSPLVREKKHNSSSKPTEGDYDQPNSKTEPNTYWSPQLKKPLRPQTMLLSPVSSMLLSHYLRETGYLISPTPPGNTPFISCLVPLSYSDDMLMHSILALSGSHLSYKLNWNIEIHLATGNHYALALRSIHDITSSQTLLRDPFIKLRLTLCILILCWYEVCSRYTVKHTPFFVSRN